MTQADELLPGRFGPVFVGGRDRSRGGWDWRRILGYSVAFVAVLSLTATATLGALVYAGIEGLDQVEVPYLEQDESPVTITDDDGNVQTIEEVEGVTNILLVGSSSRAGLTDRQLLELGTEDDGSGQLTDTIIVVQLDAEDQHVAVLSFPRDLLVERCDGTRGRINSANLVGSEMPGNTGPGCLVQTVTKLTGISIQHYVEVDLLGFIDAVDAVGGVTFYLDEPLRDVEAGLDVDAGCVTFDGTKALGFVRARKALDNDFGRIARQQRFMRELLAKSTSLETLANPSKVLSLTSAVAGALTTDAGLSTAEMARLAYTFRGLSQDALDTRTVPGEPGFWGEAEVVFMDEAAAAPLFEAFRSATLDESAAAPADPAAPGAPADPAVPGTPGAPEVAPPPAPVAPALTPADVPPLVLQNGVGREGLATAASAALTIRGFSIEMTENAENFAFETSQVVYPPDLAAQAEVVARAVPGSSLVPGSAGSKLTVVLGADFDAAALPLEVPPAQPGAAVQEPGTAPGAGSQEPVPGTPGSVEVPGLAAPTPQATEEQESGASEYDGAALSDVTC